MYIWVVLGSRLYWQWVEAQLQPAASSFYNLAI